MIKITRDSGYADRLRAYKIILDEKVIGEIKNGQKIEIEIPKGSHKLYLKIDWCRSNIIDFKLDDDIAEFECGSNLRGAKVFSAIFYIIFFRDQYISLKKK